VQLEKKIITFLPEFYTIKLITTVIVEILQKARVFATAIHFHPRLIFAGKARKLLLKGRPVRCSTLVGSSLACKY
jgi:hypothetical protein